MEERLTSSGLKSSGGNECVQVGKLQRGAVVGGREMEFGLGHRCECTGNARMATRSTEDGW
jgi:hypothetical protein